MLGEKLLEFDPVKIRMQYLRTWFMVDFLSAIPFDLFTFLIAPGEEKASYTQAFKLVRVLRLMKLMRILKTLNLLKV